MSENNSAKTANQVELFKFTDSDPIASEKIIAPR